MTESQIARLRLLTSNRQASSTREPGSVEDLRRVTEVLDCFTDQRGFDDTITLSLELADLNTFPSDPRAVARHLRGPLIVAVELRIGKLEAALLSDALAENEQASNKRRRRPPSGVHCRVELIGVSLTADARQGRPMVKVVEKKRAAGS